MKTPQLGLGKRYMEGVTHDIQKMLASLSNCLVIFASCLALSLPLLENEEYLNIVN